MRLYTGFTRYPRWNFETIFVASISSRFDAQISQTDKVFCLGVCRLSAENSERASLKSVTKIRHPKILHRKKGQLKKKKKQKNCQPQRIKYTTPACSSQ